MSEQLLDLLRIGLLALMYLFFLRVIWVVWAELRNPVPAVARGSAVAGSAPTPAARKRRRRQTRLVIRAPEPLAGMTYDLEPEMTIGRAPGCTIVIDDSFVSQVHARVFERDGSYFVEDLNSTNGTRHNDQALTVQQRLQPGDRLAFGDTVLEYAR